MVLVKGGLPGNIPQKLQDTSYVELDIFRTIRPLSRVQINAVYELINDFNDFSINQ